MKEQTRQAAQSYSEVMKEKLVDWIENGADQATIPHIVEMYWYENLTFNIGLFVIFMIVNCVFAIIIKKTQSNYDSVIPEVVAILGLPISVLASIITLAYSCYIYFAPTSFLARSLL